MPTPTLDRYPTSDLTPYHMNPRRGDVDAIAKSLLRNGQYKPIVVNLGRLTGRPLEVLAGNHTLAAAQQLGWEEIAATTIDVDDQHAARIVVADNRTGDLGETDRQLLHDLLAPLDGDLDGTGYTATDLLEGDDAELGAVDDGHPDTDDTGDQYAVLVPCVSEADQERTYNELHAAGYVCRVVTV